MKEIRVIFIRNYRNKAFILLAALVFWIMMFYTARMTLHTSILSSTTVNGNLQYSEYYSQEGGFSFDYPSNFMINPNKFSGGEIKYHVDFRDPEGSRHGFVQIWNMGMPLEEFLKRAKETSQLNYKYFNTKKTKINGLTAYYWDYSVLGSNNEYFIGNEVFLENNGQMYRISWFVPEKQWNSEQSDIFTNIVKSFRVY